ncbi:hypothetical protein [Pedobacter borealis]|uniref:hypothetical protein n=1 Tax=Pedobacter borealis TaxID=475254 RepID=UPI0012F9BE6E|nr:hypothetical protein [Pedobacter borealis]
MKNFKKAILQLIVNGKNLYMQKTFTLALCLLASICSKGQIQKKANLLNSSVVCTKDKIVVSTGKIERTWQWTGFGLLSTSLKNQLTGKEYAMPKAKLKCDWDLPGAISEGSSAELIDINVKEANDSGFSSQHLEVISTIKYANAGLVLEHVIWVFPNAPGIRTQLRIKALSGYSPEKIRTAESERIDYGLKMSVPGARAEYLPLNFSVENSRRYWGYYNNPGGRYDSSRNMLEEKVVTGFPLFLTEDINWASGMSVEYNNGQNGVCIVKESPKTVNQAAHNTGSFYSGPNGVSVSGWGLNPDEVLSDRFRACWATWTIVWSHGNDGMQLALKQFDRARYPVFPERDLFILSNTWGPANPDGSQFTKEDFVLKEIPAVAKLGIDVIQIDDGWQKSGGGPGAKNFSPKYTNGWKDIKDAADKNGVRMGLWVTAKLSTTEELNKNIDELGFISWKSDFDHLATRTDYEDRIKKYRDVMKHSWMNTQFSLCPEYDDPRYGWYYFKEYGSIFFQNIQESLPAHLTMVPSNVLMHNWEMTKYFNSNKLQVMLQNPKRVNSDRSDAPQHSHSYCFAMGVPFIPCFFQSAQNLDVQEQKELKNFITVYKKHRETIFNCYTFPIGDKPNNKSWTGFQMLNEINKKANYLLLFRELHNKELKKVVQLKFLKGKTVTFTNVETGRTQIKKAALDGKIEFSIDKPAEYLFLKYSIMD